jgi:UDP-2,3-diacylglucosamine pyrophosphatase LpxH
MAHLSKKQRQERLMEEFLRRIREASPGERVYMAVGDLFEAAEVHDLNEVRRTARRAAVDPGGGDEGKDGC